jgi:beta-lactamase regulating signal transducer with metallopeptidase domain
MSFWIVLERVLDASWSLLATGLIHGTILAALTALAGATLLRRASPALMAALWTIVLVKFVVPLGPDLPVSLSGLVEALLTGRDALANGAEAAARAASAPARAPSSGAMAWLLVQSALLLAYLGIVSWLLGRRIAGLGALRRRAEAGAHADPAVLAAVARAAEQLGLARVPAVRLHPGASTPQVVGLWRPILILPAWLIARREQLAAALVHELAHLRRRDPWVHGLQLVVGTLLCAWPVVHWVNRRIAMYREMACDQWALACGPLDAGRYARMLVAFARRAAAPAPGAAMALLGGRKQIEHRVDALLRGAVRPRLGRASIAALAAWALLSLSSTRRAEASGARECVLTADMVAQLLQHFPEADRDGDGVLTREEMCAHKERIERALETGDAVRGRDGLDDGEGIAALTERDGERALGDGERALGAGERALGAGERALGAGEIADLTELRENWDAMGLPDCAACNCSAAGAHDDMSPLAPVETKICINEEK